MTINKMIAQAERRGEQEYADILKGEDTAGSNIVGNVSRETTEDRYEYVSLTFPPMEAFKRFARKSNS